MGNIQCTVSERYLNVKWWSCMSRMILRWTDRSMSRGHHQTGVQAEPSHGGVFERVRIHTYVCSFFAEAPQSIHDY
jgi:hypothetical protein